MKTATFKPWDPISKLSFVVSFEISWDSSTSSKVLPCGYFQLSVEKLPRQFCHPEVTTDHEKSHRKEGNLTNYFEVVIYVLGTETADDVKPETKAKIFNLK